MRLKTDNVDTTVAVPHAKKQRTSDVAGNTSAAPEPVAGDCHNANIERAMGFIQEAFARFRGVGDEVCKLARVDFLKASNLNELLFINIPVGDVGGGWAGGRETHLGHMGDRGVAGVERLGRPSVYYM